VCGVIAVICDTKVVYKFFGVILIIQRVSKTIDYFSRYVLETTMANFVFGAAVLILIFL
jgi:hypothetical protein